jgi:hypothetical protein
MREPLAARHAARAGDCVAELLRNTSRGLVADDGSRDRRHGFELPKGEFENCSPHLRPKPLPLEPLAQPRAGSYGSAGPELLTLDRLRARRLSVEEDQEVQRPVFGVPIAQGRFVKLDKAFDEALLGAAVGPRDGERHLLRRVNAFLSQPAELGEFFPRAEPEV